MRMIKKSMVAAIVLILLMSIEGCSRSVLKVNSHQIQDKSDKNRKEIDLKVNIYLTKGDGKIIRIHHVGNTTKITLQNNDNGIGFYTGGNSAMKLNGEVFKYFIIEGKKYYYNNNNIKRVSLPIDKTVILVFDRLERKTFSLTECNRSGCWSIYDVESNPSPHKIKRDTNSKFSNLPEYADSIVGASLKNGVKFYGQKIWQDQPYNSKYKVTFSHAKNYCKSLDLLGIKKWTLPTREDYARLVKDKKYKSKNFRYYADSSSKIYWYWTKERNCQETGLFRISKENCVWVAAPDRMYFEKGDTPSIIEKRIKSRVITKYHNKYKNTVRCVLNSNIYNMIKKEKEKSSLNKGGIDGYLSAFMATGNKNNIQKAVSLAKTKKEKSKVEKTLYNYLGALKIFDIKIGNQIISKNAESSDINRFLIKSIL